MPIVGMSSAAVRRAPTTLGTPSTTTAKMPSSWRRVASFTSVSAASLVSPCTLKPPIASTLWGVSPRWPITGISASRSARTTSRRARPPSSLTLLGPRADQLAGVAHAVRDARVIAQPGHVGHDVGPGPRRGDRAHVVAHRVDRDVQRVLVAQHDVGHRVAHEDHVDPGGVGEARARARRRRSPSRGGPTPSTALARADRRGREAHRPTFSSRAGLATRVRRPELDQLRARWWKEQPTQTSTA